MLKDRGKTGPLNCVAVHTPLPDVGALADTGVKNPQIVALFAGDAIEAALTGARNNTLTESLMVAHPDGV